MNPGYTHILRSLNKAYFAKKTANGNNQLYFAGLYLFHKSSFRLNEQAKHDRLIILKEYFRVLKLAWNKTCVFQSEGAGQTAAFDSDFKAIEARKALLDRYNVKISHFISREGLGGSLRTSDRWKHLLFLSLLLPFLLPYSLTKRRAAFALLIRECMELYNLLRICKTNDIKRLYHFCIYEKDANFITCVLDEAGIKTSKIASEVPLVFANKILITDEICLNFGYQLEELDLYKESMFYNTKQLWIPEMQMQYISLYENRAFTLKKNSIGFYSSAFWLRKKQGHQLADVGSYDAEENVVRYISDYLNENKSVHLSIFLHPYEKRSEAIQQESLRHYSHIFGTNNMERISFSDQKLRSTETFNHVNIGLSVFSTIAFERLSLGFKTLLLPMDKPDFPAAGSPFRNICAYNKKDMFMLLNKNMSLSKDEFYALNKIGHYLSPGVNVNYQLN